MRAIITFSRASSVPRHISPQEIRTLDDPRTPRLYAYTSYQCAHGVWSD